MTAVAKALAVLAALLAVTPARLVAADGPEAGLGSRQAVVLARALSYDSALPGRAGSAVVVAVLVRKKQVDSEKCGEAAGKAFKGIENLMVSGVPFRSLTTPLASATEMEQVIEREGVDALYLCDGLDDDIANIKQLSRRRKLLTLGATEAQVKAGVSLAVVSEGTKLTIVVNLPQSKEEGAAFGSDLLRLARVIK